MSDTPLSVGLNLVYLVDDSGGSGRYARELIRGLLAVEPQTRITAFVNREAPADLREEPWHDEVDWFDVRVPVGRPPWHLAAQLALLPAVARRRGLDVLHSPASVGPPRVPGVASVLTLLDVIWLHLPEALPDRIGRAVMPRLALAAARGSDRVLAISHDARREFVELVGLPPEKIDVTPLGIRIEGGPAATPEPRLRGRLGIGAGPIVLCVAQKRRHKNLAKLVAALPGLADDGARLVIPGTPTAHERELAELARELDVAERVHLPGWISEQDLAGLYAAATCFALPSLLEGFGLPLLEAMSRGLPVACSDRSALPEVAGDAALLFDPDDQQAITESLQRLLRDEALRATLAERGVARCREFSWERTATATLAAYRRAIRSSSAS